MALAFVSCEEEETVKPASIFADKESVSIPAEGGSEKIMITSTRNWTSTVYGEGITVAPNTGEASEEAVEVVITAEPNTESTTRKATVIFDAGSVETTVTVTQFAAGTSLATISGIRELAPSGNDKVTIADGTIIRATVVSSRELNNMISQKNAYIQDASAGIQIRFAENHEYDFGAEIEIDLSGEQLSLYGGAPQLGEIPLNKVTVVSTGNKVEPKAVSITDFMANKYEGQYISLSNVQVAGEDLGKTFVVNDSHTSITMEARTGERFVIFSSKYATYKDQTVPEGSGTVSGVAMINNGTIQLSFAQESDWAGLTGARFEGVDYLTVDVESTSVGKEAGSFKVNVSAKDAASWTAESSDPSWLTVSPASGTGSSEVTVSYTAGTQNREGTITFKSGELTATCTVSQLAEGLEKLTVAEFLAKEPGDTYYELTGTITNIANTTYGNLTIKDETGDVYIYGVTQTKVEGSNDKSFSKIGLKVGDILTLATRRGEHNGTPQGGGNSNPAYYISHIESELPAEELKNPLTSNVKFTEVNKFYSEKAEVNGTADVAVFKFGTSSVDGEATMTIPAGTTKISFYGVAWNNKTGSITLSAAGAAFSPSTIDFKANAGANNNSPYTITVSDESDWYEVSVSGVTAETTVTVKSKTRAIIWGVNAE